MTLFFCVAFTIIFLSIIVLSDICYKYGYTMDRKDIISYYIFFVIPSFSVCVWLWCVFTTETESCISKHCSDYENGKIVKIYTFDSNNNKIDSIYIYK